MTQQLTTANRQPNRLDFDVLRRRVEELTANRRGPKPNARDIAFEVRKQVEPLLTEAERLGYDVNESRRYLDRLTRTAGQPATNDAADYWEAYDPYAAADLPE